MNTFEWNDPRGVLARTLWGEARGEGRIGMLAVAGCIMNRVAHPRWWGRDVLSVCLAPWQFSCWNADDPNLPKMKAVTDADPEFRMAFEIAGVALTVGIADQTRGADSYYDIRMTRPPFWAATARPTVVIGHHRFMAVKIRLSGGEPDVPTASVHSPAAVAGRPAARELTAEELNAAETVLRRHQA